MLVKMRNPTRADLALELRRVLDQVPNLSDLARTLGVARDTIYKWRRGDSIPDFEMLRHIAHATGTTIRLEFGPEAPPDTNSIDELRHAVEANSKSIEALRRLLK